MPSKWSSLNFEGGASPSSLKKASLLGSVGTSVFSVTQAATSPLDGDWGIGTFALLAAALVIILNLRANKTNSAGPLASPLGRARAAAPAAAGPAAPTGSGPTGPAAHGADVGVVINASTVPNDSPAESTVEPKFSLNDRFFSATEGPSDQFLDNSSFKDFQQAFFSRNEKVELDRDNASDFAGSFVGLQDYLKTHDVPETLLTASSKKHSEVPSIFGGNSDVSDSEARMLASEAFQQVPTGSDEIISGTLREILAAYTEARKSGLTLPPSPTEQVTRLKALAKTSGTVAELAKNILNRI